MGGLKQNMRRMTRFKQGALGMSESSCFAKRVGSVQVIEKQGLAQVAAEAHMK